MGFWSESYYSNVNYKNSDVELVLSYYMFNNSQKKKLLVVIAKFSWCQYSHHGQYQAVSVVSLNVELGRDAHIRFC